MATTLRPAPDQALGRGALLGRRVERTIDDQGTSASDKGEVVDFDPREGKHKIFFMEGDEAWVDDLNKQHEQERSGVTFKILDPADAINPRDSAVENATQRGKREGMQEDVIHGGAREPRNVPADYFK